LSAFLSAACIAAAQVPEARTEPAPRQLGIRAVMNVYYISPKTLEITSSAQLGWPTLDDCRDGIPGAVEIAQRYATEGDLVEVQCFAVAVKVAPKQQKPDGTTDL
jgi:hypothetical protein